MPIVHYPCAGLGRRQYTVYASYFGKNDGLKKGHSLKQIALPASQPDNTNVELGFTRAAGLCK